MESLAFIHTAVSYEDPTPDPESTVLDNLNVSSSALMGLAGAAVAASVMGGTSGQAMAATAPVGPGSSGQEVQAVQKALGVKTDGQYGKSTQAAVMDFQIRQGMKEIDGVVGKETAKALGLDEQYRPMGYVETNSGIGLNIRGGPGTGYFVVGGAPDGAFLEQDYETVVYNDGYAWTPLYTGGWVASDYTNEDDYYPVSYYEGGSCGEEVSYRDPCGDSYDYEEDVSYQEDDYYPVAYRPVAYRPVYRPVYYQVAYDGGCGRPVSYSDCGCNGN